MVDTPTPAEPAVEAAAPAEAPAVETVPATPSEPAAEPAEAAPQVPDEPEATPEADPAGSETPAEETPPEPEPEEVKDGEAKPEAAEAAPEPRAYEPFTFPEGVEAKSERVAEFTEVASTLGLEQEQAQSLIDLHSKAMNEYAGLMAQHQMDVFQETKAQWRGEFKKFAGNRADTMVDDAKAVIRLAFPAEADRAAAVEAMNYMGATDNPWMIRLLASAGRRLREPATPSPALQARTRPDTVEAKAHARYNRPPNGR